MKGYIYKITNENGDLNYYGSTKQTINRRLNEHLHRYKKYVEGNYNFVSSFDIVKDGRDKIKIEIIEEIDYEDKVELHQKERYYILNNECINRRIPLRNSREYYHTFKEEINNKRRQKYFENKMKKQQEN